MDPGLHKRVPLPAPPCPRQVVYNHLRPTFSKRMHPEYVSLAKQCWAADPKDRPSSAQVCVCVCARACVSVHVRQRVRVRTHKCVHV